MWVDLEDKEDLEQFPEDIHKFLKDNMKATAITILMLSYCLFGAIYYLVIKPYYLGNEMTNERIYIQIFHHILPMNILFLNVYIFYFIQLYKMKKRSKRFFKEKK